MWTRLSSKGQIVIPKALRQALGLRAGTRFRVSMRSGRIVLEPVGRDAAGALYGRLAGARLLDEHEAEHQEELRREGTLCT
jgi:antitoxin PrlF